jgi:hypothetical protein
LTYGGVVGGNVEPQIMATTTTGVVINTDGSVIETKVPVAMPVILNVTSSSSSSSSQPSIPPLLHVAPTIMAPIPTQTYIHDIEGVPDHYETITSSGGATPPVAMAITPSPTPPLPLNRSPSSSPATALPIATPVAPPPPLVTIISSDGRHHEIHHPPKDTVQPGNNGMMTVLSVAGAALYNDLRSFVTQKGDARFRSHTIETFAHGTIVFSSP